MVNAYLEQHTEYHRSANKALHKSLADELEKLAKDISLKKTELKALVEKGHVEVAKSVLPLNSVKDGDSAVPSAFMSLTEEQYTQTANILLKTEMDLLEAQAMFEAAQSQLEKLTKGETESQTEEPDGQLGARVEQEFMSDPDVVALAAEIKTAQDELEKVKSTVRMANDPARRAVEKHLKSLQNDWDLAWEQKREKIEERLLAGDVNQQPGLWKERVADIHLKIDKLKRQKSHPDGAAPDLEGRFQKHEERHPQRNDGDPGAGELTEDAGARHPEA